MHQSEYVCQWVGELNSLQTHLNSDEGCGYIEVQCTNNCGAKMKRKELKAHLAQICPLRKFQCQYCHYEDTYQTITSQHYKECLSYPLPCLNKCSTTDMRREEMNNHRSSCELEPVECPFHEAGCTVGVVRRDFDAHMMGNQQNHLLVLLGAFQELKRQLGEKLTETKVELGEKLLETKLELDECKMKQTDRKSLKKPGEKKTLEKYGDEVTFCMTNFSLYKLTSKV